MDPHQHPSPWAVGDPLPSSMLPGHIALTADSPNTSALTSTMLEPDDDWEPIHRQTNGNISAGQFVPWVYLSDNGVKLEQKQRQLCHRCSQSVASLTPKGTGIVPVAGVPPEHVLRDLINCGSFEPIHTSVRDALIQGYISKRQQSAMSHAATTINFTRSGQELDGQFHHFVSLPVEIRHEIWRLAIPPRTLILPYWEKLVDDTKAKNHGTRHSTALIWCSDLFNTCHESRQVVSETLARSPQLIRSSCSVDARRLTPGDVLFLQYDMIGMISHGKSQCLNDLDLRFERIALDWTWLYGIRMQAGNWIYDAVESEHLREIKLVVANIFFPITVDVNHAIAAKLQSQLFTVVIGLYDTVRLQEVLSLGGHEAECFPPKGREEDKPLCVACLRQKWEETPYHDLDDNVQELLRPVCTPALAFRIRIEVGMADNRPNYGLDLSNLGNVMSGIEEDKGVLVIPFDQTGVGFSYRRADGRVVIVFADS